MYAIRGANRVSLVRAPARTCRGAGRRRRNVAGRGLARRWVRRSKGVVHGGKAGPAAGGGTSPGGRGSLVLDRLHSRSRSLSTMSSCISWSTLPAVVERKASTRPSTKPDVPVANLVTGPRAAKRCQVLPVGPMDDERAIGRSLRRPRRSDQLEDSLLSPKSSSGVASRGTYSPRGPFTRRRCPNLLALARCWQFQVTRKSHLLYEASAR